MENNFWVAFGGWYLIANDILLIIGVYYFLKLPKEKKASSFYWLPFLILAFTVLYENMGAYTNYNFEFKKAVNAFLGNKQYPKYNLWLYNIANNQISPVLYLFLIKSWVDPTKKKYITGMVLFFVITIIGFQFSGIEPIYLNQPFIFSAGANLIIIGCGFYFIELMTHERYLDSNLLRLISFWQMTFVLFTYSLTYFYSVSFVYLYDINPELTLSLVILNRILGVACMAIFALTIASPFLPRLFEREPNFGSDFDLV